MGPDGQQRVHLARRALLERDEEVGHPLPPAEAYIPDERGAAEPLPFATAGPLSSPRMTLIAFSAIWVSVMADPCGDEGEAARDTNAAAFIALA